MNASGVGMRKGFAITGIFTLHGYADVTETTFTKQPSMDVRRCRYLRGGKCAADTPFRH